jgi:hypothetical protein
MGGRDNLDTGKSRIGGGIPPTHFDQVTPLLPYSKGTLMRVHSLYQAGGSRNIKDDTSPPGRDFII